MNNRLLIVVATLMLIGCVSVDYKLQQSGPANIGGLQVDAGGTWNVLPGVNTPFARKASQVWTHDGPLLDRLMIIPAVPAGEPLFVERDKAVALPRFKADMLPDELAQLTESSLSKLLGEGESVVKSANLRPTRFGEQRGVMFDLTATPKDGPLYRGMAGAFIADNKLNVILYIAAEPYYFEKHREVAQALITSARL